MRLIDADALPIWSYAQMWEEGYGINKCCIAVENAPTIEAIPVQFIEMWMNENLTNGEDDGEVDTIFEMIRDWEQEGKEYEYKSM